MPLKPGQEKCINTLDRSIVVAAGAGSGKTFTLTKRIVHAIETGVVDGIERVCAITFTNKAAGELKSRIKAELRACGQTEQALKVDEAWVSTIHGMCARILRAHAVELDIDPSFEMADGPLTDHLLAQSIDGVLMRAQVTNAAELDELFAEYPARSYGPQNNSVEAMIKALMGAAGSNVCGFDSFVMPTIAANPQAIVDVVLEAMESLAEAARAQKHNESREAWAAETTQRISDIRADMQKGGNAGDVQWALQAIDGLAIPRRAGTAEYKQRIGEVADLCRMCVMELRLAAAAPHLHT